MQIDFGTAYLAHALAHAVYAAKAVGNKGDVVVIDDGERTHFAGDAEGVLAAALYAKEIDGIVGYQVHRAAFYALHDGPYDHDNAPEIVHDGNVASEAFCNMATAHWEA